jgi:hypothetical protein
MNLTQFAHFTVDGPVLMSCDRCGEGEVFGSAGQDVGLTDLVAWAGKHVCRVPVTTVPLAVAVPA